MKIYLKATHLDLKQDQMSLYLMDLCLVEYKMTKFAHLSWLQLFCTLLSVVFMDINNGPRLLNGIQTTMKISLCKPFIFLAF
ncbi:hypothetical protein HanRHA438_Chr17g0803861 [Helianthus annuus]|nr:hypothetical protein HanRHA438_Chr17g0803861 [Helianthus annuus]